jgi:hypothetical protein
VTLQLPTEAHDTWLPSPTRGAQLLALEHSKTHSGPQVASQLLARSHDAWQRAPQSALQFGPS